MYNIVLYSIVSIFVVDVNNFYFDQEPIVQLFSSLKQFRIDNAIKINNKRDRDYRFIIFKWYK